MKKMGIKAIHVELDTHEAINLIVNDRNEERHLMSVTIDCRIFLTKFKRFKIRHVLREANKAAGFYLKEAVHSDGVLDSVLTPPWGLLPNNYLVG